MVTRIGWAISALAALLAGPATAQDDIAQKAATCAACHGLDGRPADPAWPVIWGQHAGYTYFQLRDYKTGTRTSEIMGPIAAELSRDDMKALGSYFAQKPWPRLEPPEGWAASATDTASAQQAAAAGLCKECHLGGYKGDGTIPRLAGQSAPYLAATLHALKTKTRANNPAMSSLLATYQDTTLDTLARYLAAE